MTVAKYLSAALAIGFDRRGAMLAEISTVNEICSIREKARKRVRRRGG